MSGEIRATPGVPVGQSPLAPPAAAAVLSDARLPSWLHGLRLALRVEVEDG